MSILESVKISLGVSVKVKGTNQTISLKNLYNHIKSLSKSEGEKVRNAAHNFVLAGGKEAADTKKPEAIKAKKAYNKVKGSLPFILSSGHCEVHHNDDSLKHYNGIVQVDFDSKYLGTQEATLALYEKVKQDKYISLAFESPSGYGFKGLFHTSAQNTEEHLEAFWQVWFYLKEFYGFENDLGVKALSQPCFICHTDKVSIKEPEVFKLGEKSMIPPDEKKGKKGKGTQKRKEIKLDNAGIPEEKCKGISIWGQEKLDNAVKAILRAKEGEKLRILLKCSDFIGRVVGACEIPWGLAERTLQDAIKERGDITSLYIAEKAIRDALLHGYGLPYTFKDEHGDWLKNPDNKIIIDKYLSEKKTQISEAIKGQEQGLFLEAPTGSGKTHTLINSLLPDLLKEDENAVFLVPYVQQAKQIEQSDIKYPQIKCTYHGNRGLFEMDDKHNKGIRIAVYDKVNTVFSDSTKYLIIDETQYLTDAVNYRHKAIKQLEDTIKIALEKGVLVIMVSATICPILKESYKGFGYMGFKREINPKIIVQPYTRTGKQNTEAIYKEIVKKLQKHKQVVVKISNKKVYETIKRTLINKGILREDEIDLVHSTQNQATQNKTLDSIIQHSLLPEGVKLIFVTKRFDVGIDIDNTNDIGCIYASSHPENERDFVQFCARFRKLKKLNVTLFRKEESEETLEKKKHIRNRVKEYYSICEQVKHGGLISASLCLAPEAHIKSFTKDLIDIYTKYVSYNTTTGKPQINDFYCRYQAELAFIFSLKNQDYYNMIARHGIEFLPELVYADLPTERAAFTTSPSAEEIKEQLHNHRSFLCGNWVKCKEDILQYIVNNFEHKSINEFFQLQRCDRETGVYSKDIVEEKQLITWVKRIMRLADLQVFDAEAVRIIYDNWGAVLWGKAILKLKYIWNEETRKMNIQKSYRDTRELEMTSKVLGVVAVALKELTPVNLDNEIADLKREIATLESSPKMTKKIKRDIESKNRKLEKYSRVLYNKGVTKVVKTKFAGFKLHKIWESKIETFLNCFFGWEAVRMEQGAFCCFSPDILPKEVMLNSLGFKGDIVQRAYIQRITKHLESLKKDARQKMQPLALYIK